MIGSRITTPTIRFMIFYFECRVWIHVTSSDISLCLTDSTISTVREFEIILFDSIVTQTKCILKVIRLRFNRDVSMRRWKFSFSKTDIKTKKELIFISSMCIDSIYWYQSAMEHERVNLMRQF